MTPAYADCPKCPDCKMPCGVYVSELLDLHCVACGHTWPGTTEERDQARRAEQAWRDEEEREEAMGKLRAQALEEQRKYQLAKEGKLW